VDSQSTRRFAPARLGAIAVLSALLSVAGFAVLVSPATAKPDYLKEFNTKYGTTGSKLDSCTTCHTTTQDAEHINPYGMDFGKHDHDFGAIEQLDSDGDGFTNIDEIHAGTFPGDPNDNPNTKSKPKAPPSTTTTTKPFPFSLLPSGLPHLGSSANPAQLLSILDSRQ
jgi:hypothetical protein